MPSSGVCHPPFCPSSLLSPLGDGTSPLHLKANTRPGLQLPSYLTFHHPFLPNYSQPYSARCKDSLSSHQTSSSSRYQHHHPQSSPFNSRDLPPAAPGPPRAPKLSSLACSYCSRPRSISSLGRPHSCLQTWTPLGFYDQILPSRCPPTSPAAPSFPGPSTAPGDFSLGPSSFPSRQLP